MESNISWHNIESAPKAAGIYCWRYEMSELSDICKSLIENQAEKTTLSDMRSLLKTRLCESFKLFNYHITADSPLQPKFSGAITQDNSKLIEKLEANIGDVDFIQDLMHTYRMVSPQFCSPLYIGKAPNGLRRRLKEHKEKIIRYKQESPSELKRKKSSFAKEFVIRELQPSKLLASCIELPSSGEEMITTLEYLLNRSSYPLFGKN